MWSSRVNCTTLVKECGITSVQGGFNEIHEFSPEAKSFTKNVLVRVNLLRKKSNLFY